MAVWMTALSRYFVPAWVLYQCTFGCKVHFPYGRPSDLASVIFVLARKETYSFNFFHAFHFHKVGLESEFHHPGIHLLRLYWFQFQEKINSWILTDGSGPSAPLFNGVTR